MKAPFYCSVLALMMLPACSTTETSRREAGNLSTKVNNYRQDQQKRIESLNQNYKRTYTRLMGNLEQLYELQLDQSLDLSAMEVADNLLSKWQDATLPKKFRDTFARSLDENLAKIREAEASLQQARDTYAASYRDAVLQLKKLDDVKSNLDSLAAKPAESKEITKLLETLYALYQKSQTNNTTVKGSN